MFGILFKKMFSMFRISCYIFHRNLGTVPSALLLCLVGRTGQNKWCKNSESVASSCAILVEWWHEEPGLCWLSWILSWRWWGVGVQQAGWWTAETRSVCKWQSGAFMQKTKHVVFKRYYLCNCISKISFFSSKRLAFNKIYAVFTDSSHDKVSNQFKCDLI